MKVVQKLIYACFVLIFVGGTGTVAGLIAHSNRVRLPFMWILVGGLGLFGVTLVLALGVGTYLYLFTDRKSLEYFSSKR